MIILFLLCACAGSELSVMVAVSTNRFLGPPQNLSTTWAVQILPHRLSSATSKSSVSPPEQSKQHQLSWEEGWADGVSHSRSRWLSPTLCSAKAYLQVVRPSACTAARSGGIVAIASHLRLPQSQSSTGIRRSSRGQYQSWEGGWADGVSHLNFWLPPNTLVQHRPVCKQWGLQHAQPPARGAS